MQTEFFGEARRVLVDDSSGRITYLARAVDPSEASCWYSALLADVPWRAERRWMYDREVEVPRLVAGFRFGDPTIPEALARARASVAAMTGVEYNTVGLNLYRDGRDSVAPHNDRSDEILAEFPIALLSLGATRLMTIRSKTKPRRTLDVELESGSLLVMSYRTQFTYDHAIPKTAARVGSRISCAFRVRPERLTRMERLRETKRARTTEQASAG